MIHTTLSNFASKFNAIGLQIGKQQKAVFLKQIAQGEICAQALEFFKSDECKQFYGNQYPKIADMIKENFGCAKTYFYRLIQAASQPADVIKAYAEGEAVTLNGFIASINKGEATEGEGEGEGEVSEPKAKPQSFKASCSAKGDIKISGTIPKKYASLLIEEIKKATV